ncbi:hypothetical protein HKX48_004116 [Thoreauomyces humboldtii]|nr:hypothetical protein HKX48_004116 [Thoreauomyces humboldtii]
MLTAAPERFESTDAVEEPFHDGSATADRLTECVHQIMDRELWTLCAAALFSSPLKELKFDELKAHVQVAFEETVFLRQVDDVLELFVNSSPTRSTGSENDVEYDDGPVCRKVIRQKAGELLAATPIIRPGCSLKRFFCNGPCRVVDIKGSLWRFDYSSKRPNRITLEPGATQVDIARDEPAVSARSLPIEAKEDLAITAVPESKWKAQVTKAFGVLGPNVVVSEDQLTISHTASTIVKEQNKLTEPGRYGTIVGYGEDRPGDLGAPTRVLFGSVLRRLFEDLVPAPDNDAKLENFRTRFQTMIDSEYRKPAVHVKFFGSAVNRLGFKSSDIDVILEIEGARYLTPKVMGQTKSVWRLAAMLRRNGMQNVVAIPSARVPICKFEDPETGLSCDMNFGNLLGRYNSELLRAYTWVDPRVRPLIVLVKNWAKHRDVNDSAGGGTISSYGYSLMVINYMQSRGMLPSLQKLFDGPRPQRMIVPREGSVRLKTPVKGLKARQSDQDGTAWMRQNILVNVEAILNTAQKAKRVSRQTDLSDRDTLSVLERIVAEDHTKQRTNSNAENKILLADLYFLSDMKHAALTPYVLHGKSLSELEIWTDAEGVAALFYDFLRFYAWDFCFRSDQVVSIREGRLVHELSGNLAPWTSKIGMILLIEDPFQIDRNVTGSVTNLLTVVREMRRALQIMSSSDSGATEAIVESTIAKVMEPTQYVCRKQTEQQIRAQSQVISHSDKARAPQQERQQPAPKPAISSHDEFPGLPPPRPLPPRPVLSRHPTQTKPHQALIPVRASAPSSRPVPEGVKIVSAVQSSQPESHFHPNKQHSAGTRKKDSASGSGGAAVTKPAPPSSIDPVQKSAPVNVPLKVHKKPRETDKRRNARDAIISHLAPKGTAN